jgi:hypothetical protein
MTEKQAVSKPPFLQPDGEDGQCPIYIMFRHSGIHSPSARALRTHFRLTTSRTVGQELSHRTALTPTSCAVHFSQYPICWLQTGYTIRCTSATNGRWWSWTESLTFLTNSGKAEWEGRGETENFNINSRETTNEVLDDRSKDLPVHFQSACWHFNRANASESPKICRDWSSCTYCLGS